MSQSAFEAEVRARAAQSALDELLAALEDAWRRHLAGDRQALESRMLRSTYRAGCGQVLREPREELLERLE